MRQLATKIKLYGFLFLLSFALSMVSATAKAETVRIDQNGDNATSELYTDVPDTSVSGIRISQMLQEQDTVTLYADLVSDDDLKTSYAADAFHILVNQDYSYIPDKAEQQSDTGEGTAYRLCIDLSGMELQKDTDSLKNCVTAFINLLHPEDSACVIGIGSGYTVLCEDTRDHTSLREAVLGISFEQERSRIFRGLSMAFGKTDAEESLPSRKAVLLFTVSDAFAEVDGEEFQLEADLARYRIPLYTVAPGYASTTGKLERLDAVVSHSGGSQIPGGEKNAEQLAGDVSNYLSRTQKLCFTPEKEIYSLSNPSWKVRIQTGSAKVTSASYVYNLDPAGKNSDSKEKPQEETSVVDSATKEVQTGTGAEESETSEAESSKSVFSDYFAWILKHLHWVLIPLLTVIILLTLILILRSRTKRKARAGGISGEHLYPEGHKRNQSIQMKETAPCKGEDSVTVANYYSRGLRISLLVTFEGKTEPVNFLLKDRITMGRGKKCDIDVTLGSTSQDRLVTSRIHAVLINRADQLYLSDEEAVNKTYVNGIPLAGEMRLKNDDQIQMGKAMVLVRILNR